MGRSSGRPPVRHGPVGVRRGSRVRAKGTAYLRGVHGDASGRRNRFGAAEAVPLPEGIGMLLRLRILYTRAEVWHLRARVRLMMVYGRWREFLP